MRFTKIFVLVGLAALIIAPAALALRFTDDSYIFPVGETGKAYSKQFQGAGGCGPSPLLPIRRMSSSGVDERFWASSRVILLVRTSSTRAASMVCIPWAPPVWSAE